MSVEIEGWFVPITQEDEFEDFWNKAKGNKYFGFYSISRVRALSKMVLFGKMYGSCEDTCSVYRSRDCSQEKSDFCRKKSAHEKRERYNKTNWLIAWTRIQSRFLSCEADIKSIVGEHRCDSFKEFITHNALEQYNRYTRREINEKELVKPVAFEAGFIGLEEIGNDPWQKFIGDKIKKGDFGCSQQLSGLEFLELQ